MKTKNQTSTWSWKNMTRAFYFRSDHISIAHIIIFHTHTHEHVKPTKLRNISILGFLCKPHSFLFRGYCCCCSKQHMKNIMYINYIQCWRRKWANEIEKRTECERDSAHAEAKRKKNVNKMPRIRHTGKITSAIISNGNRAWFSHNSSMYSNNFAAK